MTTAMAAEPALPDAMAPRPLRRDTRRGVLGGVCAGLAARLALDPLVVRLAFLVAALAGGLGLALYALAWALVPAADPAETATRRGGRANVEIALGASLLALSALLALREAGLWLSDALVWPLVLVAAGGALLWRPGTAEIEDPESSRKPTAWPTRAPTRPREETAPSLPARAAVVSRTGLGVVLVLAAAVVFLQAAGALTAARNVVLAVIVVAVALGVIFAPFIARLARSRAVERRERIRSQERAEVAAHLHDSVLQTLAMVQRQASEPREVAALARRQERELRDWLSGRRPVAGERPLSQALDSAAVEVEQAHGVAVEVVTVGDAPLDPALDALVAAAREAMVNAAKFAGGSTVDVYAECNGQRVTVFVRDRGPGFDPDDLPPDRQGVRESIFGRMARHGGTASIDSGTGGTEVQLTLELGRP